MQVWVRDERDLDASVGEGFSVNVGLRTDSFTKLICCVTGEGG